MECFQKDWDQLNEQFPLGQIVKTNYSMRKENSSYFSPELMKVAVTRYQKDIELFGYQDDVKAIWEKLKAK